MKIIYIILFLLSSLGHGQTNKPVSEKISMERAKVLYAELMKTADFKKGQKISVQTYKMLSEIGFEKYVSERDRSDPKKVFAWVRKNAPKDKAERIISMMNQAIKLNEKLYKTHREIYDFLRAATKDELKELMNAK